MAREKLTRAQATILESLRWTKAVHLPTPPASKALLRKGFASINFLGSLSITPAGRQALAEEAET